MNNEAHRSRQEHRSRQGVIYGILAYGWWGLVPLYFKLVGHVAPLEVLAQRVIWSLVFLAITVTLAGRWSQLRAALATPKVLLMLSASTALLSINWFTYIYAVSTNQVVEASLGYFLNPLVNVLLGVVILSERLRGWQLASLALAATGVLMLGTPPIAVTLALSFAFYGLLRKKVPVDGLLGLFIETVLLFPLAVGYVIFQHVHGTAAFVVSDPLTCVELMAGGIVTAVPLIWFAAAAQRLRLSTMGFLQYLAPSVQFLLAVFLFGEPITIEKLLAFGLIWTAVAVYSVDSLRSYRAHRSQTLLEPAPADV